MQSGQVITCKVVMNGKSGRTSMPITETRQGRDWSDIVKIESYCSDCKNWVNSLPEIQNNNSDKLGSPELG
jgi:hypothetical protein